MAAPKSILAASPGGTGRQAATTASARRARSLKLGGVLLLWMGTLAGRLYYLQVISYFDLANRGQRQQDSIVQLAPDRGILYDRNLEPLAMSVGADSIYADPTQVPEHREAAEKLARVLDLDGTALLAHLDNPAFFCHSKHFCWVARKVSDRQAREVRALDLKGIGFQKEKKRVYPKGTLASQVLGYVGMDDNGLAGIEYAMNQEIVGRPGKVMLSADARHHSFLSKGWDGEPGESVVLTIDGNIQFIAEKVLAQTVEKYHAAGGTVIVENPNNAEILAIANLPTLDANDYRKAAPQDRINRAVGWVYEPGSMFKVVTFSAALESHVTRPDETIDCQMGSIVVAHHVIHDDERFGVITVADALAHSSNVAAIKLGLRVGEDRLYHYIRVFGFGSKTGVRLPGEERGLLEPPSRWSGISIGAISMGQEVGVTPLQVANAYSAIANGGTLLEPRLLREVIRGNNREPVPLTAGRRIVSAETAATMREMFAGVVDHGTGVNARLNGYSSAGKTGTGQKIDSNGHYSHSLFVASFVGFAPVEHPAVTILVVIDTPRGLYYGAQVAAPAFKSIAEQTLGYLRIPQDMPAPTLLQASASAGSFRPGRDGKVRRPSSTAEMPGVATSSLRAGIEPVSDSIQDDAPATIEVVPESTSVQSPGPNARQGTVVVDETPSVVVPDFSHLPVREVIKRCQIAGLDPIMHGSGLAVQQAPPAGSRVALGSPIKLEFAR